MEGTLPAARNQRDKVCWLMPVSRASAHALTALGPAMRRTIVDRIERENRIVNSQRPPKKNGEEDRRAIAPPDPAPRGRVGRIAIFK